MEQYKKLNGESYEDFCMRIYRNQKVWGLSNDVAGFIINQEYPENSKDESAHRKRFKERITGFDDGYKQGLKEMEEKLKLQINEVDDNKSQVNGLPSLVPKTHLERFEDLIGEYNIRKRSMQLERNELAKMTRKVTPWVLLTEEYRQALRDGDIEVPDFYFNGVEEGESVIKSLVADWHIGVVVDESYNQYNYEIAVERIDEYCRKIIEVGLRENANKISITHLGDIVEGIEMRSNQKWDLEFLMKDQIKYATKLFLRMIMNLQEYFNIEIAGVDGNHDRLTGEKNKAIDLDNVMAVVIENLKSMIEFAEEVSGKEMKRVSFLDTCDGHSYQVEQIYNTKCRWQHGHKDNKNDEKKIEKYNGTDNDSYDIVGFGHLHHGRIIRKNRNTFEMYVGCLQGSNNFGKSVVKSTSDASQGIIIFRENGDVIPYEINLQLN